MEDWMKNWKYVMLAGVLLPLTSLLFVDAWYEHAGIINNLRSAHVTLIDEVFCTRYAASPDPLNFLCGTCVPGTGLTLGFNYKWSLILGIGLVVYGFVLRDKEKKEGAIR